MKRITANRLIAAVLAFIMTAMLLPISPIPARAAGGTYVLEALTDLTPFGEKTKSDYEAQKAGTDNYFTIYYSEKTKVDSSEKTFDDGYASNQRLNFAGKGQARSNGNNKNVVAFTTSTAATVKIWWAQAGDDSRQMAIFELVEGEQTVVAQTEGTWEKNQPYISTLKVDSAGTYYIGGLENKNYIFKIEVTEKGGGSEPVVRGDWSAVEAPVITEALDNGEGKLSVTVNAAIGNDGGDEVAVTMYDAKGKAVETKRSVAEKSQHTLTFEPTASGTYSFQAELTREGETAKKSEAVNASFLLPLGTPVILSATSKGGGKVEVVWTGVDEAQSYEVYYDGNLAGSTTKNSYTVSGLSVGTKYAFTVVAVRGEDRTTSEALSAKATKDEQRTWGFTYYGPSTNDEKNGYVGNLNEDGYVTIYSEGGKGKIVPASTDGLAFYYTAVPTEYNFTMRAKVTVDSWTLSNGQEGFGLMVADRLGESGNTGALWNNQYMALCGKIEYRYESGSVVTSGGTKYSMKMGLGIIAKTGVTKKNLSKLEANDTDTINKEFSSITTTLETAAGEWEKEAGTYNIVGNFTSKPEGTIDQELKTSFILEIQKNNTGYFITYYDANGKILAQKKHYDPDALSKLDTEYVYAGFFAARNARITVSDVTFTTILASKDAPAEEKPVTKIDPTVTISSGTVTTSGQYELFVDTNVDGTADILLNGTVVQSGVKITGLERYRTTIALEGYEEHRIRVQFTPDPNQDLGEDTVLSTTANIFADVTVTYNKANYHTKTIYVSPDGLPNGAGTREYPYDIFTAVNIVAPGQTIVLMEGTYKMTASLKIQRGMDGTEASPIRMIADPEAATRPVLDFRREFAGIVHGGDYWYFAGFDVTNSADGQKGFQVSGNNNVLDRIHAYFNGNTGIQISRYSGTDLFPDWPANNLILNCTSYCNYDKGFEDADGYAAKLTIGEGNVFDGCIAYNNADDGFDLYAKVETGPIGAVTIRNSVAYSNGFVPGVEGQGNGNGFKMGGESLSGKHVLENSYAFWNLAKGIDSNSCPDIIVRNSVSYNNGSYNVAFYTNNAANTAFVAQGVVSFRDNTSPYDYTNNDNLKGKGSQKASNYLGNANYYWQDNACQNASGKKITKDMFVSLSFSGTIARKADGTIDMQGFLELNDKAPSGAGAEMNGAASEDNQLETDDLHEYGDTWVNLDPVYHWHACECGAKADMTEHTFTWIIDKEATPTSTGLKHEECTECGYKRAALETYYEEPGATEPDATQPEATQPQGTQPSGGNDDAGQEPGGNKTIVVIVIVVVVVAAAAAVAAIVLKKKKQ